MKKTSVALMVVILVFIGIAYGANKVVVTVYPGNIGAAISADLGKASQRQALGNAIMGSIGSGWAVKVTISMDSATYGKLKSKYLGVSFKDQNGKIIDLKAQKVNSAMVTFSANSLGLYGYSSIAIAGWNQLNSKTGLMEGELWRYNDTIWTPMY